jgi:transcriptional regulator with XRE-family HTH domain
MQATNTSVKIMQTSWQKEVQAAVSEAFFRAKQRNPRYSLRSFAKKIGWPVSTISALLSGKRPLSPARAADLIRGLGMDEREQERLLAILGHVPSTEANSLPPEFVKDLLSWKVFAVMAFFELDASVSKDFSGLAERFGFSTEETNKIINLLLKSGLLKKTEAGAYIASSEDWDAGPDMPVTTTINFHREVMEAVSASIDHFDKNAMNCTTTVFAGSRKDFELIKEEIGRFHSKVATISEGAKSKEEVFILASHYIPLRLGKPAP